MACNLNSYARLLYAEKRVFRTRSIGAHRCAQVEGREAAVLTVPEDGCRCRRLFSWSMPQPRAGVKAPTTSLHGLDFALGSPPVTPARGWGAGVSRAGGSDWLVELTSN